MNPKPTIVFDFDGTLADSLNNLVIIANELAGTYNFQKFGPNEVEKLRLLGFREIIKLMGIKKYQLPKLAFTIRKRLRYYAKDLQPIKGIGMVLTELNNRDYKLGILTSNSATIVNKFLNKFDLTCFDFVFSEKNLLGKDKSLIKIKKKYGDIVYIGDEARDIEACKKANVKIIAVTWGLNSKEPLLKSKPYKIVSDPNELLKIFTK